MTMVPEAAIRLDRWLWHARIFKTKAAAAKAVQGAGVRVTRGGLTQRCEKPAFALRIGDTVALTRGQRLFVLDVVELGARRGPPSEARALYEDRSPPPPPREEQPGPVFKRDKGAGRPTKKERRALDKLRLSGGETE